MSNSTNSSRRPSRFAKYQSDLPPLFKPAEGESKVGRLVGIREQPVKDDNGKEKTIPVLDLVDVETGEEWSFMSGAWRWVDEELPLKDPADGDVIRITRYRDIGQSRDVQLEILESVADKAADFATAPADDGQKGVDDGDIPF
jgi:hypothetical protein